MFLVLGTEKKKNSWGGRLWMEGDDEMREKVKKGKTSTRIQREEERGSRTNTGPIG